MVFPAGPDAGLALIDKLHFDVHLREYNFQHAIRAELLRSLGRPTDPMPHLELAPSDAERRFLRRRLDELSSLVER